MAYTEPLDFCSTKKMVYAVNMPELTLRLTSLPKFLKSLISQIHVAQFFALILLV